jgi:hypothetical protein
VRKAVLARLIELYAKVAAVNYGKVAAQFDTVAARFTAAAGCCDPELDGAAIVGAADETRRAWLDAAVVAVELDRLVAVLSAAAQLAGVPATASREPLLRR